MSRRRRLFISRELSDDSPLLGAYPRDSYDWTDASLLDFEPVAFEAPETDWLFFYSPRCVDFFYKNPSAPNHQYKVICYGSGTARQYHEVSDRDADLVGTGGSETTLPLVLDAVCDQRICFVRGVRSVLSVQRLLPDHVDSTEIIVYDSIPKKTLDLEHYDAALITSPLSYEAFVQCGGSADVIIAIGPTTLAKVNEIKPDQKIVAATQPSEKAMSEALHISFNCV